MQVNRVGAWLEGCGVNPQGGEHFRPDSHAEFSILSAFGFVSRLPVVVNADKKGSSQKVNSLTGGRGGCLRLAGCGCQSFAESGYICLDGVQAFGRVPGIVARSSAGVILSGVGVFMVLPFCPLRGDGRRAIGWGLKVWFYNVYVMFGGILHHLPFKR